jgi:hypothetical protein
VPASASASRSGEGLAVESAPVVCAGDEGDADRGDGDLQDNLDPVDARRASAPMIKPTTSALIIPVTVMGSAFYGKQPSAYPGRLVSIVCVLAPGILPGNVGL